MEDVVESRRKHNMAIFGTVWGISSMFAAFVFVGFRRGSFLFFLMVFLAMVISCVIASFFLLMSLRIKDKREPIQPDTPFLEYLKSDKKSFLIFMVGITIISIMLLATILANPELVWNATVTIVVLVAVYLFRCGFHYSEHTRRSRNRGET
jgi:uncharacterized membrane protein